MENTTILHQKYIKKFICEKCDFSCCKKGDFTRHLQSKKHNTTNTTKIQPKKPQFRCKCGKLYIHRASLHNHQKVCEVENENLEKNKKKKKKKKFFPIILKLSIQAIILYYRPLCKRIMNFVKC